MWNYAKQKIFLQVFVPWIWNAQGIMGIKTPKTLKVQKVSPEILSQLHEAISEFF
jgi:hypothetical protein